MIASFTKNIQIERYILISAFIILLIKTSYSACPTTPIDLSNWTPINGNWTVQPGGLSVHQSVNQNSSAFFVGNLDLINAKISGQLKTTDNDNDRMGFIFGLQGTINSGVNDYYVVRWDEGGMQTGFMVQHVVNDAIQITNFQDPNFYWQRNFTHNFEIHYQASNFTIFIDGNEICSIDGCYYPGKFGFLNQSQANVTYSNFSYTPFLDFTIADDSICLNAPTNFSMFCDPNFTNPYSNLTWELSDGTIISNQSNATHTFLAAGEYDIKLTATDANNCQAETTKKVWIFNPIVDLGPDADFCTNDPVSIDGTIPNGASYLWSNLDNQAIMQTTTSGTYSLTATDVAGCVTQDDITIKVGKLPIADFNVADICMGEALSFIDNSSIPAPDNIASRTWDMGDGTSLTDPLPIHSYATPGDFDIKLTIKSNNDCEAEILRTVAINPVPTVDFTAQTLCVGEDFDLVDNSNIAAGGNISTIDWDLDDGSLQSYAPGSPLISHTYASEGEYDVKLTATSDKNCSSEITKEITVNPIPVPNFTLSRECLNKAPIFDNQSAISSGSIDTYIWELEAGITSQLPEPNHFFSEFVDYPIKLTAISDKQCSAEIIVNYLPYPMPKPSYEVGPACQGAEIQFNNNSTVDPSANIITSIWDFSNGNVINEDNPTHVFDQDGSIHVQLIVTTSDGCVEDTTSELIVHPKPQMDFNAATMCINEGATKFESTSQINTGTIDNYLWIFEPNMTSSLPDPLHQFNVAGNHEVSLIGISDFNCKDTIKQIVIVNEKPTTKFTPNPKQGCTPICIQFTDESDHNATENIDWEWIINGTSYKQQHLNYCFDNESYLDNKMYDVSLIVQNDLGCKDTLAEEDLIIVFPLPEVNFEASPNETDIYHDEIVFTNLSNGAIQYEWTFGDGTTSVMTSPFHHYSDSGTYEVTLTITSDKGCINRMTKQIIVAPVVSIYFPNTFTPNDDGFNDEFFFKNYGIYMESAEFFIFDNEGHALFTSSPPKPWDGKHKGKKVKTGTYIYKLNYTDVNDEIHKVVGHINILK